MEVFQKIPASDCSVFIILSVTLILTFPKVLFNYKFHSPFNDTNNWISHYFYLGFSSTLTFACQLYLLIQRKRKWYWVNNFASLYLRILTADFISRLLPRSIFAVIQLIAREKDVPSRNTELIFFSFAKRNFEKGFLFIIVFSFLRSGQVQLSTLMASWCNYLSFWCEGPLSRLVTLWPAHPVGLRRPCVSDGIDLAASLWAAWQVQRVSRNIPVQYLPRGWWSTCCATKIHWEFRQLPNWCLSTWTKTIVDFFNCISKSLPWTNCLSL